VESEEPRPTPAAADAGEVRRLLVRAESEREALAERLRETSAALLDANQALAQIPLLQHQIAEAREENVWLLAERTRLDEECAGLREEAAGLRARIEAFERSNSDRP
jgi:predicted  nucleic acid-binding Zn-ribbon protein